ncbi:MAG: asparagine synthase-related protein, partial [Thermoanaerobaculia bacterium]
ERFPVLGDPETCRPPLEAPFSAWDACLREALRRARARGARVLLTGHGGDDLLWGSRFVYADRLRRGDPRAVLEVLRAASAQRHVWRWIVYHHLVQPLLSKAADRALRRLAGREPDSDLPDWIDGGFARRTGLAERIQETRPRRFPEAARQALYDHLEQTPWDRSAFWYGQHAADFGIEVRHPFLDRRLIELLFSIPPAQLFRADLSKGLLRRAMAGLLPETVRLRRGKTHLSAFLELSLGGENRARIERMLAAPLAADLGIVNGERLLAAYKRNPDRLWNPIALEIWLREHRLDAPAIVLSAA